MARSVYLTMLVLLGCATAHSNTLPSATTQSRTTIETPTKTYSVEQITTPDILTHTVPAALDKAWTALPAAYGDLHIPINAVDPSTHLLGSGMISAHGTFAGARLSRLIDCGTSAVGMANADQYSVQLDVRTQLSAGTTGSTTVHTLIEATARDASTSTNPVRCGTTGTLERLIAEALTKETK